MKRDKAELKPELLLQDEELLLHYACTGGDCYVFYAQLFAQTKLEQLEEHRIQWRTLDPKPPEIERHLKRYGPDTEWPAFLTWIVQSGVTLRYGPMVERWVGLVTGDGGKSEERRSLLATVDANKDTAKGSNRLVNVSGSI